MLDEPAARIRVDPTLGLSPREAEILALVSQGLRNPQIAARLSVTVHTVKFHLAAIYRKLSVTNRTEATALYLTHALARSTFDA